MSHLTSNTFCHSKALMNVTTTYPSLIFTLTMINDNIYIPFFVHSPNNVILISNFFLLLPFFSIILIPYFLLRTQVNASSAKILIIISVTFLAMENFLSDCLKIKFLMKFHAPHDQRIFRD